MDNVSEGDKEEILVTRNNAETTRLYMTESQKRVVQHPFDANSMLVINAGPGTGKTFTLINRIAHAIEQGILKPHEILVLSMANRSVNSLRSRLREKLDSPLAGEIDIRTFHSFSRSLVDTYGDKYYPDFRPSKLMDDLSWRNFSSIFSAKSITMNGNKIEGSLTARSLEMLMSGINNKEIGISEACRKFGVSENYIRELIDYMNQQGMVRYHDLITNALALASFSLTKIEDRERWIPQLAQYKAVFVDEFQDMHSHLLSIVRCVVNYPSSEHTLGDSKHLTIAGDPNQSIYQFLGSYPELLKEFVKEMHDYEVTQIKLGESFRSTPEILEVASEVGLKRQTGIMSTKPSGYSPVVQYHTNFASEYKFIAGEITRLILESGGLLRPSDFIILTRTNKESLEINNFFTNNYGFKCNQFSSSPRWINSTLHLFIDLLNVTNNGSNTDLSMLQIIFLLDRKVGRRARISKLFNLCSKTSSDGKFGPVESYLNSAIKNESQKLSQKERQTSNSIYNKENHASTLISIESFLNSMNMEREKLKLDQTPDSILESLYTITKSSGLLNYLNGDKSSNGRGFNSQDTKEHSKVLKSNLDSFSGSLYYVYDLYLKQGEPNETFLDFFLKNYTEEIPTVDKNMVNISTIHSAKGLEFPIVFLVNNSIDHGSMSNWNSILAGLESKDNEKERLFYVACTRATTLLYVSTSLKPEKMSKEAVSRFTDTLPVLNTSSKYDSTLLQAFSFSLDRKIPTQPKLQKGGELFQRLRSSGFPNLRTPQNSSVRSFATRRTGVVLTKIVRSLI